MVTADSTAAPDPEAGASSAEGALAPFRVLDLTNELGQLSGRILGDLGADVIKIEPVGGDPSRWIEPFYKGIPDPERSLHWWMFNANKRGVTLDVSREAGRSVFLDLVRESHFVLESLPPGAMASLGLGYDDLAAVNPSIIMTSITPFGQDGPYAHWRGSDLIASAMGGQMYLNGEPDREPIRPTVSQTYAQASVQAAVGTLVANFHRTRTGQGQHVDQSAQEATTYALDNAMATWDLRQVNIERPGNGRNIGGFKSGRYVYQAADGYMSALSYGGLFGLTAVQTIEWLHSHGCADDLTNPAWVEKLDANKGLVPVLEPEDSEHLIEVLAAFIKQFPRDQLMREAQVIRNGWAPVNTPKDVFENEQLQARDYWTEVEHPELDESFLYPGPWAKLSQTPITIRRRAPRIGEHNDEVYLGLLGMDAGDFAALSESTII
jgi:benzylsuccinate CoA-transferase BbsE subunit